MLQPEKCSHLFIFVAIFRFVGEQIGFEVLVFGPTGPDIEPGRCTFLSILVFRIFFQFLNLLISKSRNLSAFFAQLVRREYLVIWGYHSNCNFHMQVFQILQDSAEISMAHQVQLDVICLSQEGGDVSRVNIGRLITTSVTSRHISMIFTTSFPGSFLYFEQRKDPGNEVVIFKMAGNFFVRYFCKRR